MYKDAGKYRKVLANSTKEVYNISIRQKNSEICEVESMIKAGIIGATGYAGAELVRLLLGHKEVEIKWYGSRSYVDQAYASVYQNMFQLVDEKCLDDNMEAMADQVDVIFTATPQGLCASLVNENILNKVKIIDLSADFRIKDVNVYEKWYGIEHKAPQYIEEAVYGLCEVNREKIKQARIIANPGCYPTCSTLSIYPLVKEQLIDPEQTAALGLLLKYAIEKLADDRRTVADIIEILSGQLEQNGLSFLSGGSYISCGYAMPRLQEIYSCFNRYRR